MDIINDVIGNVSLTLQPHRVLIAQFASGLRIAQMLSPLFAFNNMRKAKSTLGMPFFPFIFAIALTSIGIRFSEIIQDETSYNSNVIGLAIFLVYSSIYLYYVPSKEKTSYYVKIFCAVVFIVLVLVYSKYEDPELVGTRLGFLMTCLFYSFFLTPIYAIREAVKRKCTQHIPLAMCLTGTLVSLTWLLHGFIVKSLFIIAQNLFVLVVSVVQLSLFLIYPSKPVETASSLNKKDGKSNKKNKSKLI